MATRTRRARRQPFGTPEQIWAKRTGLQQSALRWLSVPIAERDAGRRPYVKTLRSLVYLRLAKWGPTSRDVVQTSERLLVTDPSRSLDESTLTELGAAVVAPSLAKTQPAKMQPKPIRRRQCAKCPWKVSTDPHEIPGGYSVELHRSLENTIAEPASLERVAQPLRFMGCHEGGGTRRLVPRSDVSKAVCVGWLQQQLTVGNNIALRLAVMHGHVSADFELDGPQHETLQDTLPQPRRR